VADGDGCEADCTLPACGNGILDVGTGEACDDGNVVDGDACESDCTLPRCGNGIVDPLRGETCDDGNQLNGDGCSATCTVQEICSDLFDNDGDGLIDCEDPDCPVCPQIFKDPAVISLRPTRPSDKLKVQGGFIPLTPIDPLQEEVGILLDNASGIIYRALLEPGDMVGVGKHTRIIKFIDKTARDGTGLRGGLYKVQFFTRAGRVHVKVLAYGDLGAATLPTMALQVKIGDDVFYTRGDWKRTSHGWKLEFARFPK
jgi:cysteine-rich repeat protein